MSHLKEADMLLYVRRRITETGVCQLSAN